MIQDIVAYFPVMEQHLRIGCGNQPDLRLFYFRTDSMNKCVKVRSFYMMFFVVFHVSKSIVVANIIQIADNL